MSEPVVVTGASGFIGQSVVDELRRRQTPFVAVSRSGAGNTRRLKDYRNTPAGGVLIHLAEECRVGAVDARRAREQEDLVATLIAAGFSRVVYASSAAVYGDASSIPRRPGDPTSAMNPYLAGKLACERRVVAAGGVVARLANVYGPGMSNETVIAEVLDQLSGSGPVTVRDLSAVRDFLWIEDAARGVVDIALSAGRGIFNLGTSVGTSVETLIKLALKIAGIRNRKLMATAPPARDSRLVLDIAETRKTFGWQPQVSVPDGLHRLIAVR